LFDSFEEIEKQGKTSAQEVSIPYESGKSALAEFIEHLKNRAYRFQSLMNQGKAR